VRGLVADGSPALDPGNGDQIDERILARSLGKGDDKGAPDLVPAMGIFFGLVKAGGLALCRCVERGIGFGGQLGLVALKCDHIIAATVADCLGHAAVTVQCIGGDNITLQRQ